mmetsp:Transcript_5432/g.12825  ORF Transcript_5432/g.12825 Transcript_5432/m.12825 type:complete len:372 (+) Transcript_5432:85-1200(+)
MSILLDPKRDNGRSSVSSLATTSVAVISLASIVAVVGFGWTPWKDFSLSFLSYDKDDENDASSYDGQEEEKVADETSNRIAQDSNLPQHLQRAVWKEQKRKESVRFLAMKKPMYDNIEMYDPDGDLLCTIAQKKANWYVKKDLGTWNKTKTAIHLRFKPKGKSENVYNQSQKQNICVSCGDDKHHMRHYVVPYCYRTLLPEKYKTHMAHDIVILCPDCSLTSNQATQRRQKELESKLRKDPSTAKKVIPSKELYHIRSCALAIMNHGDKLPPAKLEEYQTVIRKHHKLDKQEQLSKEILQETIDMEFTIPNENFIPGAQLVVDALNEDDDKIADFIRDWRYHFLETMHSRYLPIGWDVDSPVHCDRPNQRT